MEGTLSYDEPYGWWGPGRRPPATRSLAGLVAGGTLSLPAAALLAAAVRRRWSLAVVAGPSGAGKTTLLSALLPWLPPGTRRYYLRGGYEPFGFLDDPAVDPHRSVLLCNEISPHLPLYLWGEGVERLLVARRRSFQVAATAHADDALGFVRLLTGPPLRIAADLVAGFGLVVALGIDESGAEPRRAVTGIWHLRTARAGAIEIDAIGDGRSTIPDLAGGLGATAPGDAPHAVDRDAIAVASAEIVATPDDTPTEAPAATANPSNLPTRDPSPWRPRRSRPNG